MSNLDVNPHPEWPIEESCCSFHYPPDEATSLLADADAAVLRTDLSGRETER